MPLLQALSADPANIARSCNDCQLSQSRTNVVLPYIGPKHGLMVIGEAPGAAEDIVCDGFVGQAGKTLTTQLARHGINRNDFARANLVRCRPPGNRKPKAQELDACLSKLAAAIIACQPKVILLVGGSAAEEFLGKVGVLESIEKCLQYGPLCDLTKAHPALREGLNDFAATNGGLLCVPMPHTSGLSWNGRASNGRPWAEIGAEQIALAVSLLRGAAQ